MEFGLLSRHKMKHKSKKAEAAWMAHKKKAGERARVNSAASRQKPSARVLAMLEGKK